MGRSRLQARRRADNLQEILAAARDLISVDGPGALTLSAVAAQVGLTTPALYHYFDSKTALLQALLIAGVQVEADVLVATAEGWTADEAGILGATVRALYDHYRPNLSTFRMIYLHQPSNTVIDPALLPRLHPHSKRMFDALEAVLVRGRAAGRVAPGIDLRTAVVSAHASAVGLLTMLALAESAGDPLRQRDEALLSTLSDLLRLGIGVR